MRFQWLCFRFLGQWPVGSGLVVIGLQVYKFHEGVCITVSPSSASAPSTRGKDAKAKVRSTSGSTASDQVIEFSFLDRAGVVTIATEQAA